MKFKKALTYVTGTLALAAGLLLIPSFSAQAAFDASYYDLRTDGGTFDGTNYVLDGIVVRNSFLCDGTYTYYLQADGTPMKDTLTYHPDGMQVIYFDENGHECFDTFAHVKKSISNNAVDDLCYFGTSGNLYVNVLTYDQTGTTIYYANPYGVMPRGGVFEVDQTAQNYEALAQNKHLGYADSNGVVQGFYEDYYDYLDTEKVDCKVWMPVKAEVYHFESGQKELSRTEDLLEFSKENAMNVFEQELCVGTNFQNSGNQQSVITKRIVYNPEMFPTLASNGFHYENGVVVLNDLNFNDVDLREDSNYAWGKNEQVEVVMQDEKNGTKTITAPLIKSVYQIVDGEERLVTQYGRYGGTWVDPFAFYQMIEMDDCIVEKKYVEYYNGKYGPYVLVSRKDDMPFNIQGTEGEEKEIVVTRYDADWISCSMTGDASNAHLEYDDDKNEQWTNPEEIVLTYEYCDLKDCLK